MSSRTPTPGHVTTSSRTHAHASRTHHPRHALSSAQLAAYVRALADMRTSYGTSPSSRCGPNTQPLPTRATAIKPTVHHTTLAATTKRPVSPHVVVARCGYQVDALVIASVCYMRRRLSRQLHRIHVLYRHFEVSKHLVCLAVTRLKLDSDDLCRPFPQNFVRTAHWHAAEFNFRAIEVGPHDFRRIPAW